MLENQTLPPTATVDAALARPLSLISVYHKTGTDLCLDVARRLGAAFGMKTALLLGEVSAVPPSAHLSISAHSIYAKAFRLPPGSRVVRIVRDPRDVWVSGYLYHLRCTEAWCVNRDFRQAEKTIFPQVDHSYETLPEAEKRAYLEALAPYSYQDRLKQMNPEDGLDFELRNYTGRTLAAMTAWPFHGPETLTLRLEEIGADFTNSFARAFRHLGIKPGMMPVALRAIADLDILKKSDAEIAADNHIHSRDLTRWRKYLSPGQIDAFEARFGGLIEGLGYRLSKAAGSDGASRTGVVDDPSA